ncbi:hypothetical protein BH24BAC1_BH24BAC1_32090 [soil metagenome]
MKKTIRHLQRAVLTVLVLGFIPSQVRAQDLVSAHQRTARPASTEQTRQSLKEVLKQVQDQFQVDFAYQENVVAEKQVKRSPAGTHDVEKLLTEVLDPLGLTFQKIDQAFYAIIPKSNYRNTGFTSTRPPGVLMSNVTATQARLEGVSFAPLAVTVTGRVTGAGGMPLPGVTVVVKGTTVGTSTDGDGRYTLQVPEGGGTLVFSFIGFTAQEVPIDNRTTINVSLREDVAQLNEVVVTGYMTQRKADLTGSVAVISSDVIEKNSYSNVMQGLQGRVPGMHITTDGSPVGNVNVQIRGLTSMRSAPPLVVIDGLPTNINLRDINPNDIASMQVLKDAASASIYGSRAASGVILIETKSGKAGETRVTYDGSTGVSSFMNRIKMMNTAQYGQALWQAAINDGRDPNKVTQIYNYDWHRDEHGIAVLDKVTPLEWLNADKTMPSADTDWFKEGSQLGLQNNHQLTLLNGTEKAQTMLSLNFFENRGTQIHTGFRRYSVRLNSEYNLIGDRLKIGENLAVSNSKINDQNHSHSFLTMPPIIPVYTTDGGWGGTAYNLGMDDYNNPVRMLTMEKDNDRKESKILGSIYANLKLLKNLNFKTLYGVDYSTGYFRHIDFTWEEGGGKRDINNGVRNNQFHALTTTWTNTLNYNLNHKCPVLTKRGSTG